jgi:uncharacterized protein (UPF0332 family)
MKTINFLAKLKKEGRLEAIVPSEEISKSYIEKSKSNLSSAKILFQNNKLEEAVSLAYYSMYHMLSALLFKAGIKSENHSASIILLRNIFDIDNASISSAKKERIDKQYYVDFSIIKTDVAETIKLTEIFNAQLFDFISKLSNDKIEFYRKKFTKLLFN